MARFVRARVKLGDYSYSISVPINGVDFYTIIFLVLRLIRYQIMLNCWQEFAENRPTFPDLVREFDRMISMLSDKVSILLKRCKLVRNCLLTLC